MNYFYLTEFITVAVAHLLAVMSPGPDFALITRNSLAYSRRVGIYSALGLGLGIAVHVTYSLIGIGWLISQSIFLFSLIKLLGALYLIYIGYKSLKATPKKNTETINSATEDLSVFQAFKSGFFTNVLNPKATLFFFSLFSQVISINTPLLLKMAYGIEMCLMTVIWFSLIAYFFSNQYLKGKIVSVQHHIERFFGVVLIALGLKVALSVRK